MIASTCRYLRSSRFGLWMILTADDLGSKNRRLLNMEKIMFKAESSDPVYVLVTVEPEGVAAKPNVPERCKLLVNNRTTSTSEIVASALHDNCKAVLVGEKTFGKGLIQSVFELHNGSGIVIIVGKYVTPNHKDINGNGIEPDYERLPDFNEARDNLSRCRIKKLS